MDLTSFLDYALIGASLALIFRNFEEKPSQYLAILCIVLASANLLSRGYLSSAIPSGWHGPVTFPAIAGILALIALVRIEEKSFAVLMAFLATTQVLVATRVIDSLS